MIDMTDIPASWAGRIIKVYRPGMEIEGVVTRIDSEPEFQDIYVMQQDSIKPQRGFRGHITVSLSTAEGELEFRNLQLGSYNIDLIEEN